MDLNSEFDFLSFWTKGGFCIDLSGVEIADKLAHYIHSQEEYQIDYNEKYPVKLARWDTEWSIPENAPQVYQDLRDHFLESNLFKSYYRMYGKFSFSKLMLHQTPRGYINEYHSHTFDGSHLHVFFYVLPDGWDLKDGGITEIGEVVDKESVIFDSYKFYHDSPKLHSTNISFTPKNNFALVVNNINPYFRHRVTEVFSLKRRFTYMMAFGYKDNCISKGRINHI